MSNAWRYGYTPYGGMKIISSESNVCEAIVPDENFNVIVAAPEMLDALIAADKILERLSADNYSDFHEQFKVGQRIKEVIAMAQGVTP
jgi:hypothetical protein